MGNVVAYQDFEMRIPFAKQPEDMAVVGNCIHQIFACIQETYSTKNKEFATIIESYGLKETLAFPF